MPEDIRIQDIPRQEILKMIKVNLKYDKAIAKEFLLLCCKKRRDMWKKLHEIKYLLIEKDDCEKTEKYINILLNRMKRRKLK